MTGHPSAPEGPPQAGFPGAWQDAGLLLRGAVKTMLISKARAAGDFVLLIGGAGCAGKSFFSHELARDLTGVGVKASVLELDCYLLERAKRHNGAVHITGYDPRGYLLGEAAEDIRSLLSGVCVTVSPFDHRTGRRAPPIQVQPAQTLIIEGSMAFRDPIYGFGHARIFLDSTQHVLFGNRLQRELAFGMSLEQIERKFASLREDYFKFILPQRRRADLVVRIDHDYSFTSVQALRLRTPAKSPTRPADAVAFPG